MVKRILLISFIIIFLDQLTKIIFTDVHKGIINYAENTGAAFSILTGQTTFLILTTIIIISFLIYYLIKNKEYYLPLTFLIAGSLSNLFDRIYFGFVRDFIDLQIWPIFNIADSVNVIGAILLIYLVSKKESNSSPQKSQPTSSHHHH
mgnify:CR=1 FL=1